MSDQANGELLEGAARGEANFEIVVVRRVRKRLRYAEKDEMALFEGDIALGKFADLAAEGNRFVPMGVGISGSQYRWPVGIIPYEIATGLEAPKRIALAIEHWNEKTKIHLVQRTAENATDYLDFVSFESGSGCWSYVGRQGGKQVISVGPTCGTGNLIHEIGHAVGLWHEQSREDRDAYVTIHWENISDDNRHNFEQHVIDGDDLGTYDYESIMHYPAWAFSKNGSPTIRPKIAKPIGQRAKLSDGDLLAVAMLYPELYS